jgi:hypothetical protein
MEFWPGPVTEGRVMVSFAVKARQEPVPGAMQPVAEHRPEQAKLARGSPEKLWPAVPTRRSDRLALAFAAPVR